MILEGVILLKIYYQAQELIRWLERQLNQQTEKQKGFSLSAFQSVKFFILFCFKQMRLLVQPVMGFDIPHCAGFRPHNDCVCFHKILTKKPDPFEKFP